MDCSKVGRLILGLRKEKGMTQRQLADAMNISDKAISKWERGLGCPDVSLLRGLSDALSVDIAKMLLGDLTPNNADGGNMKKLKFYVCPSCGNIITSTGEAEISCCGRKLTALIAKLSDETHRLTVETIEDDFYITFSHEMSKEHYLNFVAYVTPDRILFCEALPGAGRRGSLSDAARRGKAVLRLQPPRPVGKRGVITPIGLHRSIIGSARDTITRKIRRP